MGLTWDELPEELRNAFQECFQRYENDPVFEKGESHDKTVIQQNRRESISKNNDDDSSARNI
jgi:TRAP-type C4-dicarboxylate transport system substrate-binding protein